MSSIEDSNSAIANSWKLAINKTIFILSCMALAYFLAVFMTTMFYFLFTMITNTHQEYPGMIVWQPFWILAVIAGFLVGFFKSIIDIIEHY